MFIVCFARKSNMRKKRMLIYILVEYMWIKNTLLLPNAHVMIVYI